MRAGAEGFTEPLDVSTVEGVLLQGGVYPVTLIASSKRWSDFPVALKADRSRNTCGSDQRNAAKVLRPRSVTADNHSVVRLCSVVAVLRCRRRRPPPPATIVAARPRRTIFLFTPPPRKEECVRKQCKATPRPAAQQPEHPNPKRRNCVTQHALPGRRSKESRFKKKVSGLSQITAAINEIKDTQEMMYM